MKHVWLHHGDSDKEACFRRKSAAYDILVVAGQAAIDRYAAQGFAFRRRSQNWSSPDRRHRNSDDSNLHHRPAGRALRTDLGRRRLQENHSSLPIGAAIVSALLARKATVIFRPHPARRKLPESAAAIAAIHKLLQADARATKRAHRWGAAADKPSLAELANMPMRWWPTFPESSPTSCNR